MLSNVTITANELNKIPLAAAYLDTILHNIIIGLK